MKLLRVILIFLMIHIKADASSVSTRESSVVGQFASVMGHYEIKYGRVPESWDEFKTDPDFKEYLIHYNEKADWIGGEFDQLYMFAPKGLMVSHYENVASDGEQVVLIGRGPGRGELHRTPGRFVTWLYPDHSTGKAWVPEEKVRAMYERAGLAYNPAPLRKLKEKGLSPAEVRVMMYGPSLWTIALRATAGCMALVVLGFGVRWWLRKTDKKRRRQVEAPFCGVTRSFMEVIRETGLQKLLNPASFDNPATQNAGSSNYLKKLFGITAHEIGHAPGRQDEDDDHAEGGLMVENPGDVNSPFSGITLKRFRNATSWRE